MNLRLGYYKVENRIFEDKLEAVLYAGLDKKDVTWHFNNDVYNKIDWKTEPDLSLDDFYRIRAQQIRDEYDYVIVLCSGGGDSTNVAYSFLKNGIKLDEIIASAPISGLNRYKATNQDVSAGNTMSETMLAQLPLMEQIHSEYPDVKITINDYFDSLLSYVPDDWIFRSGEWIHPTSASRYDLEKLTHIKDMAEAGKKIAIVYGIDKPLLCYEIGDRVSVSMSDLAVSVQRPPFKTKYTNVDNVLFYFSPDLPLMQVKQAHVLAKWIHLDQKESIHARSKIFDKRNPPKTFIEFRVNLSIYERAIIPCIYPRTHRKVFQGHKPTRMFLGEHDDWFYKLYHETNIYQLIESDFRNFIKSIDPKYLNTSRTGFHVHQLTYDIGPISKFTPVNLSTNF